MQQSKVILTGSLPALQLALGTLDARGGLTVQLDPTYFDHAADRLEEHGATIIRDPRVADALLLDLVAGDVARLRLLEAVDYSHVCAAARRVVHAHLDDLIVAPACPHCRP